MSGKKDVAQLPDQARNSRKSGGGYFGRSHGSPESRERIK